jgi:hypothetical protein
LGWDAHGLVLGVPSFRDSWERQYGPVAPNGTGGDEGKRLPVAEIERLRPDVVLDSNLDVLDHRTLRLLRSRVQEIRMHAGYVGTEMRFHRAMGLDLALVPCGTMATALRPLRRGRIEVLPHSFDAGIVAGLPDRTVERPLIFAGALGPRYLELHRDQRAGSRSSAYSGQLSQLTQESPEAGISRVENLICERSTSSERSHVLPAVHQCQGASDRILSLE